MTDETTEIDDDWRCPGCGKPWEELPVGHVIPVGGIGQPPPDFKETCFDTGKGMPPWEFLPLREG